MSNGEYQAERARWLIKGLNSCATCDAIKGPEYGDMSGTKAWCAKRKLDPSPRQLDLAKQGCEDWVHTPGENPP